MYLMSQVSDPALRVAGKAASQRISDRVSESVSRRYLATSDRNYDTVPTKRQIAAVLAALTELTLAQHLLGTDVKEMGTPRNEDRDDRFKQANGIGRFFYAVADELAEQATAEEKARGQR
jgi:hypothetical protein